MPVKVLSRRGKYRIVNATTGRIEKTTKGNAVDGGGHATRPKANRQASVLNAVWKRKKRR